MNINITTTHFPLMHARVTHPWLSFNTTYPPCPSNHTTKPTSLSKSSPIKPISFNISLIHFFHSLPCTFPFPFVLMHAWSSYIPISLTKHIFWLIFLISSTCMKLHECMWGLMHGHLQLTIPSIVPHTHHFRFHLSTIPQPSYLPNSPPSSLYILQTHWTRRHTVPLTKMIGGDLVMGRDPAIKLFDTTIRTWIYSNSPQKPCQTSLSPSRDVQGKVQSISTKSRTKVHKQGTALSRSVDHTKFNNYDELIAELDQLFEFGGESMAS